MSTAPAPAPSPAPGLPTVPKEIVVISHCSLFYWWPVWAVGYIMALITVIHDERMAIVPIETKLVHVTDGTVQSKEGTVDLKGHDVLVAPEHAKAQPPVMLHTSASGNLGVIYAIVLVLVVFITNVPLRGLWSVIVIIVIVMLSIIFALMGVWEKILSALSILDIRINLAGYLFISTVLLILWLIVFFVFDRQVYMIFTAGNLRVQLEIGDGETTYDTAGMTVQKQRSDLFRHWILGLGSGDLIVNTSGAQAHHFDLPNVLALGRRVHQIEELLRVKQIVAAPPEHR
jgi:hypothetical protein